MIRSPRGHVPRDRFPWKRPKQRFSRGMAWLTAALPALAGIALAGKPALAGVTDPAASLPERPLSIPGLRLPFTDPVFGTETERLLDAKATGDGVLVPEYSKLQAWNADMSMIMLRSNSEGHRIVDARPPYPTLALLPGGSQAVRWSPTDRDVLYYLLDGNNRLMRFRVSTRSSETVHTFTEYARFSRDESYEELSNDGRYIALAGVRPDGKLEIFAFDVIDGVKHRPLVYPNPFQSPADKLNWCVMSPSGRYVLVLWHPGGTGRYLGLEAFDLEMNYKGKVHCGTGHSDITMDADGTEYAIVDAANDAYSTLPGQMLVKARIPNGVTFHASGQPDWPASIANGGQVPLLQMNARNNGAFGTHTSCRNSRGHGRAGNYCVVSTEVQVDPNLPLNGWVPFQGEIFRVYLDSRDTAPHVERLAHHRSRPSAFPSDGCSNSGLYWAQPHATLSPDGSRILFGSNWHRVCDTTDPSDPFVLTVGPTIPSDATAPSPPANLIAR